MYQASYQKGHLEQLVYIFCYLKNKPKLTLYFNPQHPNIDPNTFKSSIKESLRDQYMNEKEQIPPNVTSTRGLPVSSNSFVDYYHAQDNKTRRPHT